MTTTVDTYTLRKGIALKFIHFINSVDIKRGGAQKIISLNSSLETKIIGKDQVCEYKTGIKSHINFFLYLLSIVIKTKPKVVVFHSRFLLIYVYLIRAFGVEVFFYMHAAYRSSNWIFRLFRCNHYIAVSETSKKVLLASGISENIIKIIPNPLICKRQPYFSSFPARERQIKIGYVGSLNYWKAPNIACKYLAKFTLTKNLNVNFRLIGEGPLKNCALNQPTNNFDIEFVGYKKNPFESLVNYPIIVIPSLEEGFGLVAIESMFNGKIIFYNKIPALDYILRNDKFSFSFNINDYRSFEIALQKAILLLKNIPGETELKKRSDNIIKSYSLDEYLKAMQDILHKENIAHIEARHIKLTVN